MHNSQCTIKKSRCASQEKNAIKRAKAELAQCLSSVSILFKYKIKVQRFSFLVAANGFVIGWLVPLRRSKRRERVFCCRRLRCIPNRAFL